MNPLDPLENWDSMSVEDRRVWLKKMGVDSSKWSRETLRGVSHQMAQRFWEVHHRLRESAAWASKKIKRPIDANELVQAMDRLNEALKDPKKFPLSPNTPPSRRRKPRRRGS